MTPSSSSDSLSPLSALVRIESPPAPAERLDGSSVAAVEPGLPAIEITTDLHQVIDRCVEALATAPRLNLFARDQRLVQVLRAQDDGAPRVCPITPATLREVLTSVARFHRYDARSGGAVATLPSLPLVHGLFDRRRWPGVRPLVGVLETPFLRPDGTVCQRRGYDPATRYLLAPRERFAPIGDQPTQQDAQRALALLEQEVFGDFPFVSRAARGVPVAALLTLLARPALGKANVPLFAFDASTRGTGKTLAVDMVCLIATGRAAPKTVYPSENAELEKLLGALAREAASVVAFDNVHRPVGGDALDMALTCEGTYKGRILGKSEAPESAWTATSFLTGNNVIPKGDTGRRMLKARQETDLERPETREGFRHPDLRAWVTAHRGELVTAALTMLRAYGAAGRPELPGVRPLGSFVPWSKLIVNAVVWAGGPNVLDTLADAGDSVDSDPYQAALRVLFVQWPELCAKFGPEGLTSRQAVEALYPPRPFRESPSPADGFDALRDAIETICPCVPGRGPDSKTLGYKLRSQRSRVIEGRRLTPEMGHHKTVRWRVCLVADEPKVELAEAKTPEGGYGDGRGSIPTLRRNCQPREESLQGQEKGPDDALPSPHPTLGEEGDRVQEQEKGPGDALPSPHPTLGEEGDRVQGQEKGPGDALPSPHPTRSDEQVLQGEDKGPTDALPSPHAPLTEWQRAARPGRERGWL